MSPFGRKDFTSSVALQAARSKELRLHVLCLTAKTKSFREISGPGRSCFGQSHK